MGGLGKTAVPRITWCFLFAVSALGILEHHCLGYVADLSFPKQEEEDEKTSDTVNQQVREVPESSGPVSWSSCGSWVWSRLVVFWREHHEMGPPPPYTPPPPSSRGHSRQRRMQWGWPQGSDPVVFSMLVAPGIWEHNETGPHFSRDLRNIRHRPQSTKGESSPSLITVLFHLFPLRGWVIAHLQTAVAATVLQEIAEDRCC